MLDTSQNYISWLVVRFVSYGMFDFIGQKKKYCKVFPSVKWKNRETFSTLCSHERIIY